MHLRARTDLGDRLAELECAVDVLARRFEVAETPITARAPLVDVETEPIVRLVRLVEERERPAELGHGRRDLRERVAADGGEVGDLGLLTQAP